MATLAERTDIHYWSRFSSGGGEIVETRQARASGQFRGYPLTKIGDMIDGVAFQGVDPSYAVIYRTRMLAGRWVESSDADQRLIPVVISQSLWDQLGRAPIDQVPIVLHTSDGVAMRVVGVTKSKSSYDMPTVFAHYDVARVSFPQMTSQAMISVRAGGCPSRVASTRILARSSSAPSRTSSWSSAASSCSWVPWAC